MRKVLSQRHAPAAGLDAQTCIRRVNLHRDDFRFFFKENVFSNKSGSITEPYYKPGATIHIVAGVAGRELYDGLEEPKPAWSAYREVAYGYTLFEATNKSINYKFIRNSDESIGDEFWIINSVELEKPLEIPNSTSNLTNETDKETLLEKIEELNYTSLPITCMIMCITAIFNLKFRKK